MLTFSLVSKRNVLGINFFTNPLNTKSFMRSRKCLYLYYFFKIINNKYKVICFQSFEIQTKKCHTLSRLSFVIVKSWQWKSFLDQNLMIFI